MRFRREVMLFARICCCASITQLGPAFTEAAHAAPFAVTPQNAALHGNFARAQLLVTATAEDGTTGDRAEDLSRQAIYASSDPAVVTAGPTGSLLATGNGKAVVTVSAGGQSLDVPVEVTGVLPDPAISFDNDVTPLISKAGCNMGACHASQHGKGGFKLAVFGSSPGDDHFNITRDRGARRVNLIDPAQSLLLLKPTLSLPHGGGKRLQAESIDYQILAAWLKAGCPPPDPKAPKVTALHVAPERRVGPAGFAQQLQVTATYSDGSARDVTAWTKFDSMDDGVLSVTPDGLCSAKGRGQAGVMCRFEGQAEVCTVVVPYADTVDLAGWTNNNFVDELAAAKFRELGVSPSPLADDATFLRRAYLDAIGTLPTVDESRAFLASTDPDKRRKLVDRLLGLTGDPALDVYNNQYAAWWALKWSDLIRSSSDNLGDQGMWAMHNWIKESFRTNKPFHQFVSELITAKGSVYMNGPANYFRIASSPDDLTETTCQVFLGIRLQCAKCHHHPFEKYSQSDYYGFAAFFARVGSKGSSEFGIFGGESVVVVRSSGEISHPRTGQRMDPTPLDGQPVVDPLDRRRPLAAWLTSQENAFFARNVVNRYVAYLLGRGLVEPIDDMRATNPPTNRELLDALAKEFVAGGFDLKRLLRTIMNSRLYQLDYQPTAANAGDSRFYSHFQVKRLTAEQLVDGIDFATGVQTKYPNLPLGTRAIELPDANYNDYSLAVFGKPRRTSVCECERTSDPSLAQTLHVINGAPVSSKISSPEGRVAKLLAAKKTHEEIVDELYLATLCRLPGDAEKQLAASGVKEAASPNVFYEDLLWALINSKQFLFNR